ncbi:MAG TPA: NAD-dependent epimerase/dehydratase family protein [Anaeromyxobacter sp.]|nr:NAD-dependent epimerase/dehydratase family protein [Anaeromyxobacter sp.]
MRVLVTGGAGFLGTALARLLLSRGHSVRVLDRGTSQALEALGVELLAGDATDPAVLRAAVAGQQVVVHLAGIRRSTDAAEFLRVNAEGTRAALEACLAAAPGLSRFVLAGSRAAVAPSAEPVDETAPFGPAEPYGASKAEAERIALSYADRLPVAVARPPRIMGPGDRENLLFFQIARRGWAIGFSGPARLLSWIDVDDAARGFLLLAEHPEAVGQAYFLSSPEPTSTQGLMLEAAQALGVHPRRVTVPKAALRALALAADGVTNLTGRRLPLNRKLAAQVLAAGWQCDPGKARARLGFEARTTLRESIERAARWYLERGWL